MPKPRKKREILPIESGQLMLNTEPQITHDLSITTLPKITPQKKSKKIYITGATGRLGREVLKLVPGAIPLVRKSSGLKNEIITDFSEPSLKSILKDADVLLHLAGSVNTLNPKEMREVNVELTGKIVSSLSQNCKIIFASSISVYGKKLSHLPVSELTPPNPDSDYSRSKYEAEKTVSSHPNHLILRIGTLYGPAYEDYMKILQRLKEGRMKLIGNGNNRIPFTHVADVAVAISNSTNCAHSSDIYVLSGECLTQKEIYSIASDALGVKPPEKNIGLSSALLLSSISEFTSKLSGKKPSLTREQVSVLGYDRLFDCTKAKTELNFTPRLLSTGIKEMVEKFLKTI